MRPYQIAILLGVTTSTLAIAVSEWTDTGSILYPTEETVDSVAIGGTTEAGADIFLGVNGRAVFNEQGNNADFKIEGNGKNNLFFVDASTDRIGIETASPDEELTVSAAINTFVKVKSTNTGSTT